jgi:hypothetical protein
MFRLWDEDCNAVLVGKLLYSRCLPHQNVLANSELEVVVIVAAAVITSVQPGKTLILLPKSFLVHLLEIHKDCLQHDTGDIRNDPSIPTTSIFTSTIIIIFGKLLLDERNISAQKKRIVDKL